MVPEPQQQHAQTPSLSTRIRSLVFKAAAPLGVIALTVGIIAATPASTQAATSDHMMCGFKVSYRTQTVSIDPYLASTGVTYDDVIASFAPWNNLFQKYHGFPIFAPYAGDWQDADILLTAQGYSSTWVNTKCSGSYVQRGNNQSIVFLGANDAWRNKTMLSHELGHTLGFADHGSGDASTGHIGFKPCGNYIGVMSYCTSPQSWFMDFNLAGSLVDGQLIRDYWQP
ncbi:MAG: hypothetical protein AB7P33_06795 [Dehalococcoidia bacterium]